MNATLLPSNERSMTECTGRRGSSPRGRLCASFVLAITALACLTACDPIGGDGGAAGTAGGGGSPGESTGDTAAGAGASSSGDGGATGSGGHSGATGSGGHGGATGSGGHGGATGSGGHGGATGSGGHGGATGSGGHGGATGSGGHGGATGSGGHGGATGSGGHGGATGSGGHGGATGSGGHGGATGSGGHGGGSTGGGGPHGTCVPGSIVACYTGPAGTSGVGRCAPGTQTCRPDGFGYGACTGEVTPAPERCATPEDESCDGEPHCPQPPPWARGFGAAANDAGFSIASDAAGNYYVSGTFSGTVDFGTGPLTSAGQSDIFFLKLDPSGSVLWSMRIGAAGPDRAGAVTVDGSGNVFLTGLYSGSPELDGCPLPDMDGSYFVAQFDPDGTAVWSHSGHDPWGWVSIEQIAIDAPGNIYLAFIRSESAVLAKLDAASKALLWTQRIPGDYARGARLALDSAGNPVIAATESSSSYNPRKFLVSKYAPTGDVLWQRAFLSSAHDGYATAHAVAINEADEIFVTGTTDGTIDFGGGTLPGGHVLVQLDAAGEYIFSRSIRFGHRIVIDPAGDLVVAGRGLAKLDASGTELWSINFDADVQDVSLSPTGTIAVTGGARGPVDFWSGPIAFGGGSSDAYVATFNPPTSGGDDDDDGSDGAGSTGAGGAGGGSAGGDPPATCMPGSVVACYTGPNGTRGVGRCAPGTQTCLPDGAGYGPCVGEVTPTLEVCATPEDEGCDGDTDCAPRPPWSRGYGGTGADEGASIASDPAGNYYVVGTFEGTIDFGAGPLTSAGGRDIFLLKLDPAGALLWSKRFGVIFDEVGRAVAVDGSGNVLLAGTHFTSEAVGTSFGGCEIVTHDHGEQVFVAKLDPEGNHIWSQGSVSPGAPQMERPFKQLVVDALGDAYVTFTVTSRDEATPSLAKLDAATGDILWSQPLAAAIPSHPDYEQQKDEVLLAIDSAGDVVTTSASIVLAPSCPCVHQLTVQKLTTTGDVLWSRQFSPSISAPPAAGIGTSAWAMAVNAADEILVTGYTDGTIDFGGGVLPAGPVLIKLDAAGQHVFSRSVPFGETMALDPDGGIFVAGNGLSRLDASGTVVWTSEFDASARDIAISPAGMIAITGTAERPVDFGTGPIPYAAGTDVFVATFDP
ncbi:outer membrane protein assembly factor BamB family protein [Sorangium sp. So ce1097]|uniref:outer membrane protein assembly factor BamB family protein n=1 Tax=Sorangium sp. So ce1097 TaxID=3133330 RepID=UPI003F5F157F